MLIYVVVLFDFSSNLQVHGENSLVFPIMDAFWWHDRWRLFAVERAVCVVGRVNIPHCGRTSRLIRTGCCGDRQKPSRYFALPSAQVGFMPCLPSLRHPENQWRSHPPSTLFSNLTCQKHLGPQARSRGPLVHVRASRCSRRRLQRLPRATIRVRQPLRLRRPIRPSASRTRGRLRRQGRRPLIPWRANRAR